MCYIYHQNVNSSYFWAMVFLYTSQCVFVLFVVNIIFIMRDENLCTFLLGNIGLPFFSFGRTVTKAY